MDAVLRKELETCDSKHRMPNMIGIKAYLIGLHGIGRKDVARKRRASLSCYIHPETYDLVLQSPYTCSQSTKQFTLNLATLAKDARAVSSLESALQARRERRPEDSHFPSIRDSSHNQER